METAQKVSNFTARWLFILCLPVVLLTGGIAIAVNSQWFYEWGFDRYDVGQTTGLEDSQLEKAAGGLIDYFNSDNEYIELTVIKDGQPFVLFNQREIVHLKDVKELILLDYWLLLGTGGYVLLYTVISLCWLTQESRQQLAAAAAGGSGLTLGVMLTLGLMALIDFDWFFLQFHLISFANDIWQLDPSRDYLIMLFPGGFWSDATLFCAILILALTLMVGGVAGGYLLAKRRGY
jgi:integral membrane protein (TIGR01906 family)